MTARASSSGASRRSDLAGRLSNDSHSSVGRVSFHCPWSGLLFNQESNASTYCRVKNQIIAACKVKKWKFSSLAPFHFYYPEVASRNGPVYKMDFSNRVLWPCFPPVIEMGGSNWEGCGFNRGLWVSLYPCFSLYHWNSEHILMDRQRKALLPKVTNNSKNPFSNLGQNRRTASWMMH